MNSAVLVLSLLVAFCSQLETAAQSDSMTITPNVMNTTVLPQTNMISVISTVEVTSPDMTPVDVLTMTDMINISTVPVLSPTNVVMMTSLLSVNSSFMMTISTTAMPSSSVDVTTPITTSSSVMSSSTAMSVTTTNIIATGNPMPVPEDDDSGFSTGAIIGIAAGGGAALLFIVIVICCCCCWCHYRKHHHEELILMSPTVQTRPENCVIQRHDGIRDSQRSGLSISASLRSLRSSIRRARGKDGDQSEGVKLMYQTPL